MNSDHAKLAMIWAGMMRRCYDPGHKKYASYGGRGITVCGRWHDFATFARDVLPRPEGMSLDRKDNNKGYSPGNCRWATAKEQACNTRKTINLTARGRTQTAQDWAREVGKCHGTIIHRVKNGWSHEDAIFGRRFAKRYPDLEFNGERMSIPEWAKKLGIPRYQINRRLRQGKSVEEALAPLKPYRIRRVNDGERRSASVRTR